MKNHFKRVLASTLFVFLMIFAFSCQEKTDGEENTEDQTSISETETTEETTAEITADVTSEETEEIEETEEPKTNEKIVGSSGLVAVDGIVDTYIGGEMTHHNLAAGETATGEKRMGETLAVLFYAKGELTGINYYLSSYSNNVGTITFSIYKWDTDYEKTLSGEMLCQESATDFDDNVWAEITFDKELPSAEYLMVLTGSAGNDDDLGVAVWTQQSTPFAKTFINGEEVDGGIWGQLFIKQDA